jgi:hypothetical protein
LDYALIFEGNWLSKGFFALRCKPKIDSNTNFDAFETAHFSLLLQQNARWNVPVLLKSSSTKKAGPWR